MKYALTGGISGIGAHTVKHILDAGHQITVFDIAPPPAELQSSALNYIALNLADGVLLLRPHWMQQVRAMNAILPAFRRVMIRSCLS